jgi:hypothetical protein
VNILFIRVPPNHQESVVYLMMTNERFLNSLISTILLPSTSDHLFWKRDLESYEYLEACSHQWQVLLPSTVGNTSMSLDRWILQVFDLNTFIHTCKNVLSALIMTRNQTKSHCVLHKLLYSHDVDLHLWWIVSKTWSISFQ